MDLRTFLAEMPADRRERFAVACGTTLGHLRNVAYGIKPAGESLAINIERESGGAVPCEETRPDVDWAYLRGTKPPAPSKEAANG